MLKEGLARLISRMNPQAEIIDITKLDGGVSSIISRAFVKWEDEIEQIVVRIIDNQQWIREEPDLIKHERAALRQAEKIPIGTPVYIASDEEGTLCDCPSLLMSNVPGNVDLRPENQKEWTGGLAKALHAIHQTSISDFGWNYHAYCADGEMQIPSWTNAPENWNKVFDYVKEPVPTYDPTFIHRDYHPNNVLWENGEVSGVVDWVNACVGPAGIDVGHCRWNLAMLYGTETADDFLTSYKQYAGKSWQYDVYWDLRSLADVLADPLEVYEGWKAFGVDWLTPNVMAERMDDYARHLIGKIPFP